MDFFGGGKGSAPQLAAAGRVGRKADLRAILEGPCACTLRETNNAYFL